MITYLTVALIVVSVFLIIATGTIIWLLVSKSRKKQLEAIKKQAEKEKQLILGRGYKEINDQRKNFKQEKQQVYQNIALENERLEGNRKMFEKINENLNFREAKLNLQSEELVAREKQLDFLNTQLLNELEEVSGLKKEEAKRKMMKSLEKATANQIDAYLKTQEDRLQLTAKQQAAEILTGAMEKYWTKIVAEKTVSTIKIDDDDLKGRIIGREGRNIRAFEQFGGVDIIIDETPNVVQVSSFNPIRREIAVRTLKKLVQDGRIQPIRIEQELLEQERILDDSILEVGNEVVEELGIIGLDPQLVYLVGKLKYRTSYSQNVLTHSVEAAKIAGQIANELGLDSNLATRAALLHDIGKALDFEQDGSHVTLGVDVCQRYGESEIVLNAIAAHHEDVPKNNVYSVIVAIADGMSAARQGARNNTFEDFVKRMHEIEAICDQIPGVVKSYALQSGRQIRVIVDPIQVSDFELLQLSNQISQEIKQKVLIPGDVTLTLIREKREVQKF